MKKFLLILFTLSLFHSFVSFAIPAYPKMIKVTQADGTQIEVRLLGDEHRHLMVTEDGYPLAFNAQTQNYEYASIADGKLISSGIKATPVAKRSIESNAFLSTVSKDAVAGFFAYSNDNDDANPNKAPRKIVRISDVPTIGTHKALVVLVNFSNKSFSMTSPTDYYDDFFHKTGFDKNGAQGCVYEWYAQGSNYNYDPQFDIYGPVTVSGKYADYAGDDGTSDTYKMIREVIELIDDEVNFADYDTDNDGVCDNIYCIYAGYGQADTGNTKYIWPHSGYLSQIYSGWTASDYSMTADSVKIDRYTVSCEMNGISNRVEGIGTFVHEFGHVLGLADHYNNQNSYSTNQPGEWDVMASGSYNNDQNTPPLFTAFERYSLGWMDLTELTTDADTIISLAHLEDSVKAYRVSTSKSNEYFIIENRQKDGWDKYIPGHGALVWHIDESQSVWDANMPNYYSNHQRVDIVEAAGTYSTDGQASDAFPGTKKVKNYTFNGWDGKEVFGFCDVAESNGVVQFLIDGTDYKIGNPTLTVSNITGTTATLKWDTPSYARTYNLYVKKGEEQVLKKEKLEVNTYDLTGLEAETEYKVQIVSVNSKLVSDTTEVVFTTTKKTIDEEQVVVLPASDITTNSFTANWEALDVADSYELTLMTRELTGKAEVGTGFDDFSAEEPNLPEGWTTDVTSTPSSQYYGEALPSFRFNVDGTYLEISRPGSRLQQVRFWHRSNNKKNYVIVEQLIAGEWQRVDSLSANAGTEVKETIALDDAEAVRLTYHHSLGYFLIDDIYATYSYSEYKTVETLSTVDTSFTFNDLDVTKQYSYAVRAVSGSNYTSMSDTIDVDLLVDGIKDIHDNDYDGDNIITKFIENGRLVIATNKGKYTLGGQRIE